MKRTKRTNTDMRLAVDFTSALALPFPLTKRESRRLSDANVQIGRALNYAQRVGKAHVRGMPGGRSVTAPIMNERITKAEGGWK